MKEYILDDFIKGRVAINCKTKEESEEFISYVMNKGFSWFINFDELYDGEISHPFWERFNENTCYSCRCDSYIDFCDIDYYLNEPVEILPLSHITKGNKVGVVKSVTDNYSNYMKEILKIFHTKEEAETYVNELIKKRDLEIEKELAGKTEEEIEVWWEENEWYDIYNIIPIKD